MFHFSKKTVIIKTIRNHKVISDGLTRKNTECFFESSENRKIRSVFSSYHIILEVMFMKGQVDTQYGKVLIDTDVIAIYAGSVAVECFGIVGMAAVNVKDGLVRLLKRDYLNHGINVTLKNNKITLDFHVIVSYGVSISTVSDNLISTVKYQVEEFTGMEIEKVNIFVEGVRVID